MIEQVACLVADPGAGVNYICLFDELSPVIRQHIAYSPYNLCLACLVNDLEKYRRKYGHDWQYDDDRAMLAIIRRMENLIRNAE